MEGLVSGVMEWSLVKNVSGCCGLGEGYKDEIKVKSEVGRRMR